MPPPTAMPPGFAPGSGVEANATGYAAISARVGYPAWRTQNSTAYFEPLSGGSVSVELVSGPNAGREMTFVPSSGDGAGTGDPASDYMRVISENGEPLVAVIETETESGNIYDSSADVLYAYRSTEGMTENMPLTGKASYYGTAIGYGPNRFSMLEKQSGSFSADVDFGSATLNGKFSSSQNSVEFEGAIAGNTFNSVAGTIAYSPVGETQDFTYTLGKERYTIERQVSPDPSYANQENSNIEGAFYGDAASSIAGTYVIDGNDRNDMIGAFAGDLLNPQP